MENKSKQEIKSNEEKLNNVLDKYIKTLQEIIDILKTYKN